MWKLTRRRRLVTRVAAIPEFDLPLITALIRPAEDADDIRAALWADYEAHLAATDTTTDRRDESGRQHGGPGRDRREQVESCRVVYDPAVQLMGVS